VIPTTLVIGASATERERAIAVAMADDPDSELIKSAILLEGLSDGKPMLLTQDNCIVIRIAAGCLCCSNNMIMRTYLNRLIQQKPQQLFLSLSNHLHLERIKDAISSGGYENVLEFSCLLDLNHTAD